MWCILVGASNKNKKPLNQNNMTAVEFLETIMPKLVYISKSNKVKFDELIKQAKEMEKDQIGYSEEDVRKAILFGQGMELWKEEFQINGFIQSLQQKHELTKSE